MKIEKTKFEGIFKMGKELLTINLVPREKVYGEKLIEFEGKEYRVWNKWRSKPAAAISKGLSIFPIKPKSKILYLGIASGTTASHFSDIIGREGRIYGIEISSRVLKDLLPIAQKRGNILPILADARKIDEYKDLILEKVDVVYCDVADPQEVDIFIRNSTTFLKPKGFGLLALKSRSIDVVKKPKEIYKETRKKLEEYCEVKDFVRLDPFQKDHGFFVCQF
ncbi:MAG: fibrillin [Candidatus Aenigmarchaeota archaeon ex4484_224]|nr:MAG: fibrillin [Candidatus Aenigmarchaeota archaeon ex4484_224]